MAIDFPSNPTNGQVYGNWIFDSSITAWRNVNTDTSIGTLNAMGLKNVVPGSVAVASGSATTNANGTVTFTGATSVSLNGVFTSTYNNYKIIHRESSSNSDALLSFRYRSVGADATGTLHNGSGQYSYQNGTAGISSFASQTSQFLGYVNSPGQGQASGVVDIFTGNYPKFVSQMAGSYSAYGVGGWTLSGNHFGSASYDGITFIISAGTFTGTIQVFGYNQ